MLLNRHDLDGIVAQLCVGQVWKCVRCGVEMCEMCWGRVVGRKPNCVGDGCVEKGEADVWGAGCVERCEAGVWKRCERTHFADMSYTCENVWDVEVCKCVG